MPSYSKGIGPADMSASMGCKDRITGADAEGQTRLTTIRRNAERLRREIDTVHAGL
jgi:hypothetical protein